MRNRVDALGVSEPEIRKEAGNRITIALAGIKDKAQATSIIGSTAAARLHRSREARSRRASPRSVAGGGSAAPKKSLYELLHRGQEPDDEGLRSDVLRRSTRRQAACSARATRSAAALAALNGNAVRPRAGAAAGPGLKPTPGQNLVAKCDATLGCPGQTAAGKKGSSSGTCSRCRRTRTRRCSARRSRGPSRTSTPPPAARS